MSSERAHPADGPAIAFRHVGKSFGGHTRADLIRSGLRLGRTGGTGWALDDICFEVGAGEIVGIIGDNGAGKTTILKVAAGISSATTGDVFVRGVPSAVIEIGMSFHPQLTGWENLPLAAALLGVASDAVDDVVDRAVEFSGIRRYLDLPVKHFSTGMVARLSFSLATHVRSPVLLVDEVLAVGDRAFQARCVRRVREVSAEGTAVLFVSHNLDLVCQVCDRAISIDGGRVVEDGPVVDVVDRYARRDTRPAPPAGTVAEITELTLAADGIETGGHLDVAARVTVHPSPTGRRAISLASSFIIPPHHSGSAARDTIDGLSALSTGDWGLTASVGPVPTTAGRLDYSLALIDGASSLQPHTVAERSTPFEVDGEDVGVIRIAMSSSWTAVPTPQPPPLTGAPLRGNAPIAVCNQVRKQFGRRSVGESATDEPRQAALDSIDLVVEAGSSIGLIGANGAGKSTLLRVLAGVTAPTSGRVEVTGRVGAVLELGAGFHGDLSGNENLEFAWRLNDGEPQQWTHARVAIEQFADIGDVLDQPVKRYSTGMRARLAMALVLELRPDLLLIDEALSVGDQRFRDSVRERVRAMVAEGTAVIFASHDLYLVSAICDRTVQLVEGRIAADGPTDEVIERAGGLGWIGAERAEEGSVSVHRLQVDPVVDGSGPFTLSFVLTVLRPVPGVYLELSIREHLDATERHRTRTEEEILAATLCLQQIEGIDEALAHAGRYEVQGSIDRLPLMGRLDVVVTVVDGIDATVLSEQWQAVAFGDESGGFAQFEIVWQATRLS